MRPPAECAAARSSFSFKYTRRTTATKRPFIARFTHSAAGTPIVTEETKTDARTSFAVNYPKPTRSTAKSPQRRTRSNLLGRDYLLYVGCAAPRDQRAVASASKEHQLMHWKNGHKANVLLVVCSGSAI